MTSSQYPRVSDRSWMSQTFRDDVQKKVKYIKTCVKQSYSSIGKLSQHLSTIKLFLKKSEIIHFFLIYYMYIHQSNYILIARFFLHRLLLIKSDPIDKNAIFGSE